MTEQDITNAAAALEALYTPTGEYWTWPNTLDEAAAVAKAVGAEPITDDVILERFWESAEREAAQDWRDLARLHLGLLEAA